MRIAIPTSNRTELFKRTGRTKEFAIFDVENGSSTLVEYRANPHKHEEEEDKGHHEHSHADIVQVLIDCDALLVHTAGSNFRKDFDEADIPLFQTKQSLLLDVINIFASDMLRHKRI